MNEVSLTMSQEELRTMLEETAPGWPLFPELNRARVDTVRVKQQPAAKLLLADAQSLLDDLYPIPPTTYSLYREFRRSGTRYTYEEPY